MEILIVILGLVIDRITKIWALKSLTNVDEIVVINNIFSFSYLENRGAAFGIFQNRVLPLAIVTSLVSIAMVYYLLKYKPKSKVLRMSLALIISGAIGNLIDRYVYKYVVDFIMFHYKDVYYFPTFNFADMLVVVGTALLAICILRDEK
ncbi:signal peptidase II [Clostridium sp. YIM B02515]|uniref:Lipoprotein signal peptidase n=1 Tax=Clostridium rhizosphaerae TaxID=2803861 RepID=A0ABS1TEX9_9CLOT|nr:signal peptidase II [Clostridium rhizosphaerae]MBL4937936.1 signal peptidase II [Clostridium rhizosphaerae]